MQFDLLIKELFNHIANPISSQVDSHSDGNEYIENIDIDGDIYELNMGAYPFESITTLKNQPPEELVNLIKDGKILYTDFYNKTNDQKNIDAHYYDIDPYLKTDAAGPKASKVLGVIINNVLRKVEELGVSGIYFTSKSQEITRGRLYIKLVKYFKSKTQYNKSFISDTDWGDRAFFIYKGDT